jgi:hypothetical protein
MPEKNFSLINLIKLLVPFTVSSVAIAATSPAAQAVQFNFSYAQGTTLKQMIGFEMAGGIWNANLADPVSVNIYVEMTNDLPTNVIGGALPGISAKQAYDTWRTSTIADRKSADDTSVINNLQDDKDKFTSLVDGYKVDNNSFLNMTRANAKALGMLDRNNSALDGYILMNNLNEYPVSWNYNHQNTTVANNHLDFVSVGIHEIGHVLGFVSGVDKPGWLTQKTQYQSVSDYYAALTGKLDHVTPLDLFRYSTQSIAAGGSGDPWIDMSMGGNPYFSVDGGKTALGYFATGEDTSLGGDGEQASHWKQNNNPLGIMNPVLNVGQKGNISTLDRRAMDAIGWDLGMGTVNFANLELQAKQRLAARIGKTVAWLEANPLEAERLLSQDRSQDVETMIDQSKIYKWGSSGGNKNCSTKGRSRQGSGCKWQNGFWQHFSWQTVDPQDLQKKSVPEPSAITGLFGLLGLGAIAKLKLQSKR